MKVGTHESVWTYIYSCMSMSCTRMATSEELYDRVQW